MKKFYNLYFKASLSLLLLTSGFSVFAQNYTDGVFVLNEGGAGSNNASVSFIGDNNVLQNNIYATANSGAVLGDTGQNIGFNGDYAYIVLNVSNKIKVVNRNTFQLIATISTGLSNPRFIAFANGKGYVTCWGDAGSVSDDYVGVINLASNTIESTIPVAEGAERILLLNNKLYVAHQGGYGYGNTISVIDPATDTVETTIPVGDVPNSMVENDGILYVLCGGRPSWATPETYGKLVKINLTDNTVISQVDYPSEHPSNLKAGNNGILYYTIDENIFATTTTAATPPATPLFSIGAQGAYGVYGMDVINDHIFVADAGNYVSPGHVYVYSTDGFLLQNLTVGVIPSSFYKALPGDLGTGDNHLKTIALYPNPAVDVFYINSDKQALVKVYDISGRMVKNQIYSTSGITVSDLNKGIYVVEITIENKKEVQRLIIK